MVRWSTRRTDRQLIFNINDRREGRLLGHSVCPNVFHATKTNQSQHGKNVELILYPPLTPALLVFAL